MAFCLSRGEQVDQDLRRIAREELESASGLLHKSKARGRDDAIHEARKSLKKVRSIVRLISPDLAAPYDLENRRLRGLGRRLSVYRDTAVMIEIFDQLMTRHGGAERSRARYTVRHGLLAERRTQSQSVRFPVVVSQVATALAAAGRRVERWPIAEAGFDTIAEGLEEGYRRARKEMAKVRRHGDPGSCHEWRKRVKNHWYHIRLLEGVWTGGLRDYEKDLKELETRLGDHHNLEVLCEKLNARPDAYGTEETVRECLDRIGRYQKELRQEALSLGKRIFRQRPAAFLRSVADLWNTPPAARQQASG
jgi:CHAD domain-containing protein